MRVAILSTPHVPTPPKGYGASELIAGRLAEGLIRRGHVVRLFAADESSDLVPERRVYPASQVGTSFDQREFIHVGHALHEIADCDVVHNHCVIGGPAFAGLSPRPFVTTLHYLSPMVRAFPGAAYITVSHSQRGRLPNVNVVAVIHNGIDPDEFPLVTEKDDYLLFLGRFHPNKGADLAIAAARQAGRRLIIAAPSPPDDQRDWFEAKVRPGLGGSVEWIGPVEGAEKARLLGRAAATLAPIRWDEPFGLVFAESMASGTPPIAFRKGAAPEVIDDGATGFLVEDVPAMVQAIERVNQISPAVCRERVVRYFSVDRMVEAHEKLYESLVARENSPNLPAPAK